MATVDSELFDIPLPKWPGFMVNGDPVSKEQAGNIILRTADWQSLVWREFFNPRGGALKHLLGEEGKKYFLSLLGEDAFELDLYFLRNTMILGNPLRGWCNWDGSIKANYYNIGERPTVIEVYEEWRLIAETFPYLTLKCQLYPDESCFYEPKGSWPEAGREHDPIIEFSLFDGEVNLYRPGKPLCHFEEDPPFNESRNMSPFPKKGVPSHSSDPLYFWRDDFNHWVNIVSALNREFSIKEENLGLFFQNLQDQFKLTNWEDSQFYRNGEMWLDYALEKGWLTKPPKIKNCWAIRQAVKEMNL